MAGFEASPEERCASQVAALEVCLDQETFTETEPSQLTGGEVHPVEIEEFELPVLKVASERALRRRLHQLEDELPHFPDGARNAAAAIVVEGENQVLQIEDDSFTQGGGGALIE